MDVLSGEVRRFGRYSQVPALKELCLCCLDPGLAAQLNVFLALAVGWALPTAGVDVFDRHPPSQARQADREITGDLRDRWSPDRARSTARRRNSGGLVADIKRTPLQDDDRLGTGIPESGSGSPSCRNGQENRPGSRPVVRGVCRSGRRCPVPGIVRLPGSWRSVGTTSAFGGSPERSARERPRLCVRGCRAATLDAARHLCVSRAGT